MKKIGILGGLAWPSTVLYYSELCRKSEQWHRKRNLPAHVPEITIESVDVVKVFSCLGTDGDEASWSAFDDYHRAALQRLEASGADFALMAANTPHHRFEAIVRGIQIPVLSMIEAIGRECERLAVRQVLLLGTAVTMSSQRFREGLARHGVRALPPQDEIARRTTIDLIADLQQGREQGAAVKLDQLAKRQIDACFRNEPAAVCLACTELPLAFHGMEDRSSFEYDGFRYINSTLVHIDAAFQMALEG